jgi:antitoxin HigA-1
MKKQATTLPPLHPGEVLREEFLLPYGLSAYALAKALHIPRTRIERIVREETGITTDTALRLARFFDTTAQFWLNLQNMFDMETTEPAIRADLDAIEPGEMAAA